MDKKGMAVPKVVTMVLVLLVVTITMWWAGGSIVNLAKGVLGLGGLPECGKGKITELCLCGDKEVDPKQQPGQKYCCSGRVKGSGCVNIGTDTVNIKVVPKGVYISGNKWQYGDNSINSNKVSVYFDKRIDGYSMTGHPAIKVYKADTGVAGWFGDKPDKKEEWEKYTVQYDWFHSVSETNFEARVLISELKPDTYHLIHVDSKVALNQNNQNINPNQEWIAFRT